MLSELTIAMANRFCGGSSRKLISGWWYSILSITVALTILSFIMMGRRPMSEGFTVCWSAVLLCCLSIGGTMIMRKFHNSLAVGFFLGSVVACSQLFLVLFMEYLTYGEDQKSVGESRISEYVLAALSLGQSILLGSFATILAAHRTEVIDGANNDTDSEYQQMSTLSGAT